MRKKNKFGKRCIGVCWGVTVAVLVSALASTTTFAQDRSVRVRASTAVTPVGSLPAPVIRLLEKGRSTPVSVDACAGQLALDAWGYRFDSPRLRCALAMSDEETRCRGRLSANGSGDVLIDIRSTSSALAITLDREGTQINLDVPAKAADLPVRIAAMPVQWLQPAISTLWPAAHFGAGKLDAQLRVHPGDEVVITGSLHGVGLSLDTDDGRIAAAGMGVTGDIDLHAKASRTAIRWNGRLQGGEWLLDPLYVAMPPRPVALTIDAVIEPAQWRIERLAWGDADVLSLEASALYRPGMVPSLAMLDVALSSSDLTDAGPRYLDSVLALAGLSGLELQGGADFRVELRDGLPDSMDLLLRNVSSADARQRFEVASLDGNLHWRQRGEAPASQLRFDAGGIYGVALGRGQMALASGNGEFRLASPARVQALGGVLQLAKLLWKPAFVTGSTAQFELGLDMRSLDIDRLGKLLGWPSFGGTLSGSMPSARYADGVMRFDGGLDMDMFDGRVRIDSLSVERPFGVAPTLAADLRLADLDLVPLTRSFGFGEISGRLEGHVNGLRLVDWAPVAFDADLHTSTTSRDKRRISQRAVNDLSSVGGSGIAGGLQARMLKVFDTFGYSRIGLKCRLENNVCHMGGLDSSATGYTIVEGSGLPRVSVIGHQREVDWPVLLKRLEAAADGQVPQVQ
ncbi:MAG: hypothetical protein KDI75_00505 [Xanthomonadales bacterium]|nr:hypothetical protein [Xanthomonadales bacterium]